MVRPFRCILIIQTAEHGIGLLGFIGAVDHPHATGLGVGLQGPLNLGKVYLRSQQHRHPGQAFRRPDELELFEIHRILPVPFRDSLERETFPQLTVGQSVRAGAGGLYLVVRVEPLRVPLGFAYKDQVSGPAGE